MPARGAGGALCMTGWSEPSSEMSRGLMTMSAGAGFPFARDARLCAKLIEGWGSAWECAGSGGGAVDEEDEDDAMGWEGPGPWVLSEEIGCGVWMCGEAGCETMLAGGRGLGGAP